MSDRTDFYACEDCDVLVEVLKGADKADLACCGTPMTKLQAKTEDASTEKHVPYIEKTAEGVTVKVGQNTAHPMEEKHYIEWIELTVDGVMHRAFLKPGDAPQATFRVTGSELKAREHCNVHGLWKS